MKVLELFCGTKSIGKVFEKHGDEVISLDILEEFNPTILKDILSFDYKKYEVGEFDYIHASPPCTEYSKLNFLNTNKKLNLEYADSLVKRAIEIIEYLKPKYWTLENPQTGSLKDRPFMIEKSLPYFDIDYCRFGFDYKKRTRFWSNIDFPKTICLGKGKCPQMEGRRHKTQIRNSKTKLYHRYRIPELFIEELYKLINNL